MLHQRENNVHSKIAKSVLMLVMVLVLFIPVKTVSAEARPNSVPPERETWVAPDGQIFYVERFSSYENLSSTGDHAEQYEMIVPLSSGWASITHGYKLYNYLNQVLWSYAWRIEWSYDGTKITSLNVQRLVQIYAPGYSFQGEIASNSSGGVNQWSYYHFRQGDICLIDYGSNCAWHFYPVVEQWVHGDGAYYGTAWL